MTWHEKLLAIILKLGAKINPDGSIEMTFEQYQQLQETIKKEFHMSFAELLKELGISPDAGMVLKNSGIVSPKNKTELKLSRHGIMDYVLSTENPKTDSFIKLWLNDCLKTIHRGYPTTNHIITNKLQRYETSKNKNRNKR